MPTLKDVAALAGVSVTTVSIVLNGKARERKIPMETCSRIESAMRTLNYQPNIAARRLRKNEKSKPIVALYWPIDHRTYTLAFMINQIQTHIKRRNFSCEFIIQTYENDHLDREAEPLINGDYNAVIMGGLSAKDLEFMQSVPLQVPVVLINRYLEKFSSISTNNEKISEMAVGLFQQKNYHRIGLVASHNSYYASSRRLSAFREACKNHGIDIPEEWQLYTENTMEGGMLIAQRFLRLKEKPKAIFCDSDMIALGMIYHFNRSGLHVPEDLEILCIALMLDKTFTMYSTPSISSISLPHDEIAAAAISLVIDSLAFGSSKPQYIEIEPALLLRESFTID